MTAAPPLTPGLDAGFPQGTISPADWRRIHDEDGRVWAALRVAEGLGTVDPTFAGNAAASRAAGETIGPYFVFHPWLDPTAQADMWFEQAAGVGFAPGDLRPAIDVELDHDGARAMTPAQVRAALIPCILRMLERWGVYPAHYSFPFFLHAMLAGATAAELAVLAKCPLWYASYSGMEPDPPAPWTRVTFWQDTGGASFRTPGGAPCDTDYFAGDADALAVYAGRTGAAPTEPAPAPPEAAQAPETA
jgi:GH25 family lysozyme M1 (1,4-beta-N-acetylmuramidase)